ncbi:MAG: class I SAM-dependent methyltransferase [Eggerthellaceae bacterium]|nr:class I SAM-dependent methyltransferase [Eggerthellaceae bacterium]
MNDETIRLLIELNNVFYRDNHELFSNTRKGSWPGWTRVCNHLEGDMRRYRVLDVACGNLRFERYFRDRFPYADLSFDCIDSCPQLFQGIAGATLHEVDVLDRLMKNEPISPDTDEYDLAVSFGFMHHIPTQKLRIRFLSSLVESLKPGGIAATSFWRFATDDKLAKRAAATTEQGVSELGVDLEENDYLVGWDGKPGVYRYCHSFSLSELDEIMRSIKGLGTCIDRFDSDGRNGALNCYTVIRRR